jgi:hypothetical protein
MREIVFFVEDTGHETVLSSFVQRFATQYNVQIEIVNRSATGGHGRVISELRKYLIYSLLPLMVIVKDIRSAFGR